MASLPSGTITFLFTDVEGSTRLWEEHPQAVRQVMARHDALLTAIFERHDGTVVRPRGEGDSLFAVFVRASDAIAGALAGQRALAAEEWGEIGALRVRMGLHTGEADLREGDYYGSAVNRCARIRAAGHGGQTLLSQTTADLVRGSLPAGTSLRSLGAHRLRDLSQPESIFQLEAPDLAVDFPPLKTLASRPNNLPLALTGFVGREQEVSEVVRLLGTARLLTLTGPGGTGKTRLALQVAADLLDGFGDGVFFVDLAPLADPVHVAPTIAQVLGVRETEVEPLTDTLRRSLREKTLLLVLDNFEHVLPAAALVPELLAASPGLTVLATSRGPLHLRGEREYPVPPLPLPATQGAAPDVAAIARAAAVELFLQRAQDARPDFTLTAENAAAVAAICTRLDGLPLAIELAAARVKALPPVTLLARLERRLPLLVGGARDAPARQQTLRDTIAWSHALLTSAEQVLLQRLAVFAGGCTLEAAEAVCAGDAAGSSAAAGSAAALPAVDVLETLASLVDKSLVRQAAGLAGEPRYLMLETVREFALEQLAASGEEEDVRQRLAVWALAEARRSGAALADDRLAAELDTLRAVLAWCVAREEVGLGARLVGALADFWFRTGLHSELRAWPAQLLALPEGQARSVARARLLLAGAIGRFYAGAVDVAIASLEECIAISRETGDRIGLVLGLAYLAFDLYYSGRDLDRARELLDEGLPLAGATGDPQHVRWYLAYQATIAVMAGDAPAAHVWLRELEALAAATAGPVADEMRFTWTHARGELAFSAGDLALVQHLWQEYLHVESPRTRWWTLIVPRLWLGIAALYTGDLPTAAGELVGGLAVARGAGQRVYYPWYVQSLGQLAARAGDAERAGRLFGAAARAEEQFGIKRPWYLEEGYQADRAAVRAALGEEAFAAAWAAGRALTPEQAVDEALAYGRTVAAEAATGDSGNAGDL